MNDDFDSFFTAPAVTPVTTQTPEDTPVKQVPADQTPEEPAVQPAAQTPAFDVLQNVDVYKSPFSEILDKKLISEIVALPSMLRKDFLESVSNLRQADVASEADVKWWGVANVNVDTQPSVVDRRGNQVDLFERALTDVQRKWSQRIGDTFSRPLSMRPASGVLDGRRAVQYARSAANLGTYFTALLPHTGAQVTFRSPSEGDLVHFMGKLSDDMEALGRRTNGMFLSSEVGLLLQSYLEFAMQHIDECTINYENFDDLASKINIHDLPMMIWGVAGAIWSKGFQFRRSCTADHTTCRHVAEGMVDLRRLQWLDNSSLGDWQLRQLSTKQKGLISAELLERYRKETPRLQDVRVTIIPNIEVEFSLCSASDYFASSSRWISSLEERYISSMGLSAAQRTSALTDQAKASALRQYAHLVKTIYVNGCSITDRGSIEETLDGLSAHDEFRNTYFEKVNDFLDASVFSVVGVPTYKCPSCGKEQISAEAKKNVPGIIPVNVFRLFFFLMPQKVKLIQYR